MTTTLKIIQTEEKNKDPNLIDFTDAYNMLDKFIDSKINFDEFSKFSKKQNYFFAKELLDIYSPNIQQEILILQNITSIQNLNTVVFGCFPYRNKEDVLDFASKTKKTNQQYCFIKNIGTNDNFAYYIVIWFDYVIH